VWTVIERSYPTRWSISGRTGSGGSGIVCYRLRTLGSGTMFEREFRYPRPNLAFFLANRFLLEPRIVAESWEATDRLKRRIEALPRER
jgi:hypothetical protein